MAASENLGSDGDVNMNMARSVTLNPSQSEHTTPSVVARYAALTVAATGLIALCAHVAVPLFFTPVPITLQTLAVLFLGLLMGPRWAFATMALYLAEGAAHLPVFSPLGPGGLLQLQGPTGGYLLSYPFAAAAAGLLYSMAGQRLVNRFTGARFLAALCSAFAGSLLILAAGASWLAAITHQSAHAVLTQAVLPFLAGDAVKVCLAAAAFTGTQRAMQEKK